MPSTTFTIGRTGEPEAEFTLHERCCFEYGRIDGVRTCLRKHLEALRRRVDALVSVLATDDPEKAERFLLDGVNVSVTEVVLRPRSDRTAFDALMTRSFSS
jgi:hypothetical protein